MNRKVKHNLTCKVYKKIRLVSGYPVDYIIFFSTDENFKKSTHLLTLLSYTLLIMSCCAKQC